MICGHTSSYYWKGKDINTLPFTSMLFGLTSPEQYSWFYYGGGMELMKHGVLSFPGGSTGVHKKEINTLEDLKGLNAKNG